MIMKKDEIGVVFKCEGKLIKIVKTMILKVKDNKTIEFGNINHWRRKIYSNTIWIEYFRKRIPDLQRLL